ncbi:Hypothetical predicted protein [Octopus vulgaris]|uniref:Uncharacterized protein n=2 Tax=Octopus TaxID=6643 RepID=A0AA36BHR0_OCTVU|nr:Hypothetical predicted protein [Octopus vulgaris]
MCVCVTNQPITSRCVHSTLPSSIFSQKEKVAYLQGCASSFFTNSHTRIGCIMYIKTQAISPCIAVYNSPTNSGCSHHSHVPICDNARITLGNVTWALIKFFFIVKLTH